MTDERKNNFKIEITQEKLVDVLMHTATREDISSLRIEIKEGNDKLDNRINKLDDRIDRLDNRIDRLDDRIDSNFKWTMGAIIVAILIPIGLKFIPMLQ